MQGTINYKSNKETGIPADTKLNHAHRLFDRSRDPVGYEHIATICLANLCVVQIAMIVVIIDNCLDIVFLDFPIDSMYIM